VDQVLESRVVGPLPLVAGIIRDLGLVELLDQLLAWDPTRCRLSPGQRIAALIVNMLGGHRPLYRVGEFYRETVPELLFGPEVNAGLLTDDALARALDKLAAAGPKAVYGALALRVCLSEGIREQTVHFDTTSRSLYGEYPELDADDLQLVRGYSKDSHPELKQLVLALLTDRQGIPIWGEVRDGNSADVRANADAVAQLCAALQPEQLAQVLYVADSALVSGDNLQRMAEKGLRFVSRLPERYQVARAVKEAAWAQGRWQDVGQLAAEPRPGSSHYQACEQAGEIEGHSYRLVVVHSDQLETRKTQTFAKELDREKTAMAKDLTALGKQRFSCEADAETAAGTLLMHYQNAWHPLRVQVVASVRRLRRARRGRPRADEPVREVEEFVIQGQIGEPDPQRVKAELRCRGSFVLITSEEAHRYPAGRLLQEYRGQQAVEQRFRFLKDPLFVEALYLHTPSRIEALGYVMIMACLVYSILEHRVRRALQQRQQEIILPGKRRSSRPTAGMLLAMCQAICVARIDHGPWMFSSTDARDRVANLVELAGLNFTAVYAARGPTAP
jgi:transposase